MEAVSHQMLKFVLQDFAAYNVLLTLLCMTAADESVRNLLKDERLQQQVLSIDKSADREKVQSAPAKMKCPFICMQCWHCSKMLADHSDCSHCYRASISAAWSTCG